MLARSAILVVSFLVLIGLLGYWWILSSQENSASLPERVSVFAQEFSDPAFRENSTSNELIALARSELQRFQSAEPESPVPWNLQGDFLFRTGDNDGAIQAWNKALQLDRSNSDALFGLANLAFEAGDYDRAAAMCESLIAQQTGNPRVPLLLADTYLNQNKPDLAVLTLQQHIASEQASVQALEMLGNALVRTKEYDEAIDILLQALRFNPKSTKAHYEIGQAYLRKKEPEKAKVHLEEFRKLSELDSQSTSLEAQQFADREHGVSVTAQVMADLGMSYRLSGKPEESEDYFLRALKLQPDRIAWLQELQSLYVEQGKNWEAIDVLKRLAELEPGKVEHFLAIGGLFAELEQPELAVEYFRKAIALAPKDSRCIQAQKIIDQLSN